MPSRHLLLKTPPKPHFKRVSIGRQPEMKIEKTMIHRLERQGKAHLSIDLPSNLRESRHRTERHGAL
jgi:hypothetical protein